LDRGDFGLELIFAMSRRKAGDPLSEHGEATGIDHIRADVGHPAAAELRHAIDEHGAIGITRTDQAGIVQPEAAEIRFGIDQIEFVGTQLFADVEQGRTAAAEAVAS
jgi:hypothetical protein